jgi:SAM-dependent methyltransferase
MSKESYDEVPYPTGAIQFTQPQRLAGAVAWAGWAPPPLRGARVLEIGCATGGNLVPLAARHPDWILVGVDYSPGQIETAVQLAGRMGLDNLRFVAASVEEITPAWGQFDYIITHGVYTWVPEPVQAAILRVSRENLAAQGVAYISFNTLPGWHWRGVIRDFLLQFTPPHLSGAQKVAHAMTLLQTFQAATPPDTPMGQLLKREVPALLKAHPSYVLHEFYESDNRPLHLAEFMRRAESAGLRYGSDVAQPDVDGLLLSDPARALMAAQGEAGTAAVLQMRDYLRGEQFHRALLVHAERQPERGRPAALVDRLAGLGLVGQFMPHPNPKAPTGALLCRLTNHAIAAPTPEQRALIDVLNAAWPGAVTVDKLLGTPVETEDARAVESYLKALIADGAVRVLGAAQTLRGNASADPPQIDRCCRLQLECGLDTVTTLTHEVFRPDALQAQIMRLADGQRPGAAVTQALQDWARQHPEQLVNSSGERIDAAPLIEYMPQLVLDFMHGPAREAGLLAPTVAESASAERA